MFYALGQDGRLHVDAFGKNARFPFPLIVIEPVDAAGEVGGRFTVSPLKIVRLAILQIPVFLVSVLDENQLAELTKGDYGAALAAFPQGLVTLPNGGSQLFSRNGDQVTVRRSLQKAPLRGAPVASGDVGQVVLVTLARWELVEAQQPAGESGNRSAVFSSPSWPGCRRPVRWTDRKRRRIGRSAYIQIPCRATSIRRPRR